MFHFTPGTGIVCALCLGLLSFAAESGGPRNATLPGPFQQPPAADASAPQKLNILIIDGEGAINNIKQRTARETIVQVEDENHKPVAGAIVLFSLPGDGPGGTFAGQAKIASVVTDSSGRAAMPQLQPNQLAGKFQIRVSASANGQHASAGISQGNTPGGGTSPAHAGLSGKTIAILAGVVAAGEGENLISSGCLRHGFKSCTSKNPM